MKFRFEKDFQTAFKKWLEENPPWQTEVYELKLIKSGNFGIKHWIDKNPHQARGLMQSKKDGCYHKLSDMSRDLKPFDAFFIMKSNAFLVVYFNEFEGFVKLDIEDAIKLTKKMKTVSFQELSNLGVSCSL